MKMALVILTLVPSFAFAAFNLDDVESISCEDAAPSKDLNVSFYTDGDGAGNYERTAGMIPYAYGNQIGKLNSQTGTMKVANNPQAENGVVVLQDTYLPDVVQILKLTPTADGQTYTGALTGHVEYKDKWIKIQDHAMNCEVLTPRILR